MRLGLITLMLASAITTAAIAQQNNPLAADAYRSQQEFLNSIDHPGVELVPTSDWSRCRSNGEIPRQQAIRSCGRVIGERSSRWESATAYYYRAMHYERLSDQQHAHDDFAEALRLFDEDILSHRNSSARYYNRGILLQHVHEYDRAKVDFRRAAELSQEWDQPHFMLGNIAFETGDYAGAIAEYDLAASINADNPYDQASRCQARAAAGTDLETAAAACEEALRLSDSDKYTLFARGYLRFMQGDLNAAGADFAAALAKDDDYSYAAYGAGVVALRQGRQAEGDALMARAADLSADDRAAIANAGLRP